MSSLTLVSCVHKLSVEIKLCQLISKATRLRNKLENTEAQILEQLKKQKIKK